MLKPLQSELLNSIAGIKHGFFTRQGGVSLAPFDSLNVLAKYDNLEHVLENRRRIAAWFGVSMEQLFLAHQVHGNDTQHLTYSNIWTHKSPPKADTIITSLPHHVVGVMTADCVPILMVDIHNHQAAAVHAGWRGVLMGVVENTLDTMEAQGSIRRNIYAAIGPSIQQSSYEVGSEVHQQFIDFNKDFARFLEQTDKRDHYLLDVPGVVYYRLQQAGIMNIDWLRVDTYTNPELFFSCRRNSHGGNKFFGDMMAGIMLQG